MNLSECKKFVFITENESLSSIMKSAVDVIATKITNKRRITIMSENELIMEPASEITIETVFVVEYFCGKAFDLLKKFKIHVLTPKIILELLHEDVKIPPNVFQVNNLAMKNVVACFSSVDEDSMIQLTKQMDMMFGEWSLKLKKNTTHLITNNITTIQCIAAHKHKIKVMKLEWVMEVLRQNLAPNNSIHATNSYFEKFKLPMFYGIIASAAKGITIDQQTDLLQIAKHGGKFLSIFSLGTRINIIFMNPEKIDRDIVKLAHKHKIPCIDPRWVANSVAAGYALLPIESQFIIAFDHNETSSHLNLTIDWDCKFHSTMTMTSEVGESKSKFPQKPAAGRRKILSNLTNISEEPTARLSKR